MSAVSQTPSLLLGTRNLGKVREITTILGDVPLHILSLEKFERVGVPAETADTYAGNAIVKAQFYARESGMCALADDSGLEVTALGGAPGVLSARFAGANASDADRRTLLLSELAKVSRDDRTAHFVCAVAIATPDGKVLNVSEGVCTGTIISEPRGHSGFGYDPLFVPDGFDQTFAELANSIKNRISHRARALLKTRDFLIREPLDSQLFNSRLLDPLTSGS